MVVVVALLASCCCCCARDKGMRKHKRNGTRRTRRRTAADGQVGDELACLLEEGWALFGICASPRPGPQQKYSGCVGSNSGILVYWKNGNIQSYHRSIERLYGQHA